jgi:hypothetical protein
LLWDEEIFVKVDIKSFADQVISHISRDQRSEKYFSIDCRDGNRVVKDNCVVLFLNFLNVRTWNFQLGLPEENIRRVEPGVEKESMRR